jgi:hypothetical protein
MTKTEAPCSSPGCNREDGIIHQADGSVVCPGCYDQESEVVEIPKQGYMTWDQAGTMSIQRRPTKLTENPQLEVQAKMGLEVPAPVDPDQHTMDIGEEA